MIMRGFKTRTTFYRRTIACVCTLLVLFLLIKACIEAHPGWMIAIQGICFGSLVTMMVAERRISDAYVEAADMRDRWMMAHTTLQGLQTLLDWLGPVSHKGDILTIKCVVSDDRTATWQRVDPPGHESLNTPEAR